MEIVVDAESLAEADDGVTDGDNGEPGFENADEECLEDDAMDEECAKIFPEEGASSCSEEDGICAVACLLLGTLAGPLEEVSGCILDDAIS